jgi:NAD(P)-dependent dehydrogenase (short-subunit alcohol dehydrogenase family)
VPYDDLQSLDAGDWERILGVNLIGAWSCVRAVAPAMRERGAGSIVNVASDAVFTLDGSSIAYVASKVALAAVTTMLAEALAPTVRVNAVAPGWMLTPWLEKYVPAEPRAALESGDEPAVPLEAVADEVVRLLADDGATGRIVRLDPPS